MYRYINMYMNIYTDIIVSGYTTMNIKKNIFRSKFVYRMTMNPRNADFLKRMYMSKLRKRHLYVWDAEIYRIESLLN